MSYQKENFRLATIEHIDSMHWSATVIVGPNYPNDDYEQVSFKIDAGSDINLLTIGRIKELAFSLVEKKLAA